MIFQDIFSFYYARLVLIIGLFVLSSSCAQLEKVVQSPSVTFESFRLGESTEPSSITLIPTIKMTNMNSFPIPLDTLSYRLMLNTRTVFNGTIDISSNIPANEQQSIDIPVRLTKETFDFFAHSLFQDKHINYKVDGDISIAGLAIPFDHDGTIFMPEVTLGEFKVNSVSLSNIDMSLSASVQNKNDFDLPFQRFSYNISSDNTPLLNNEIKQNGLEHNTTTHFDIPIRVNPSNIITSALQLLTHSTIDLDMHAVAMLGFVSVPLF